MQTHFTADQLADPDTRASAAALRRCVHCGFCNARCPTYLLTGDELDSPRGRIYLIKEMLEGDKRPTPKVVHHLDRCLSCLSCKTTCPSGVDYMQLIDHARTHIEEHFERPWTERLVRHAVAAVFPRPRLFGPLMRLGAVAAPLAPWVPGIIGRRLRLAGMRYRRRLTVAPPPALPSAAPRVLILEGCVQPALGADINRATRDVAVRLGFEPVAVADTHCCGAIELHLGDRRAALARIRKNIDHWLAALDEVGAEHIVVNASGCGTMLKHYAALLADEPEFAERAALLSEAALDFSEWVALNLPPDAPSAPQRRVAYHSACSLQHGQGIHDAVIALLQRLGLEVVQPAESHICCGSAGTYNLFQPELAEPLGRRKAAHLAATEAEWVVTGNLGCALQIGAYGALPIVHTAEMVNWALAAASTP